MLLQVLDDGYLTDSLGRKLISKYYYYHDFKCGSQTIKRFWTRVGFLQLQRVAQLSENYH
jgi:TRAP-type mannitol/chloroaromatic compound transport system substrate-binding protein